MGDLRVWDADIGGRLFTIMSGQRECRDIRNDSRSYLPLYAETIGGSMLGPTRVYARIPLGAERCWEWTVYNNMSSDALLPCRRAARFEDPVSEDWLGFTQCDSRPMAFLNITPGVMTQKKERSVRIHELDHIRFVSNYGSCAEWKRVERENPQVRIDMEAQAFCASARHEYEDGTHPSLLTALSEQAAVFSWYFWNGNQRKAMDELAKWCKA